MPRLNNTIRWLLGIDPAAAPQQIRLSFGSEWASSGAGLFWILLGLILAFTFSFTVYSRYQEHGGRWLRMLLAAVRASLLSFILLMLTDPILKVTLQQDLVPALLFLFDGTSSMEIQDASVSDREMSSRIDRVQSFFQTRGDELTQRLRAQGPCDIQGYVFDGTSTSRLRPLSADQDPAAGCELGQFADQLTTSGQVTALGAMLDDLSRNYADARLAGIVIVSDFAHNAGGLPLSSADDTQGPAVQLGVPVHTLGVGDVQAADLAVDLQLEPKIRRGEKTVLHVKWQQTQLAGRAALIRVNAQPVRAGDDDQETLVGEERVILDSDSGFTDFDFIPRDAGEYEFTVVAEPLSEEVATDNNRSLRHTNVIDDFVRLTYVAYEPTWEWRFIKEVFHRDRTVGLAGFRTFLASSDPQVRRTNTLFLSTLATQRNEFFTSDVIFLDDMPAEALSGRFCEMVDEFVGRLGGGLVVLAGPRFGPSALADTPLANMLPVVIDKQARLQDKAEFRVQLKPIAANYRFMNLGDEPAETMLAWDLLDRVPWYQPVAGVHDLATVLAEHPDDMCADGRTKQPLIAIRRYGAGEVVYVGFNETWRLRSRYGEQYYRRFWSPLIDRLGMSHALGARKRFVVRLDARQYRVGDDVTVSVQASDENYEPLAASKLDPPLLQGTLASDTEAAAAGDPTPGEATPFAIPSIRDGLFETKLPVLQAGRFRVQVIDPITGQSHDRPLEVSFSSAEGRSAVRNAELQDRIAAATGGRSYTLHDFDRFPADIRLASRPETIVSSRRLWTTPLWFIVLVSLMLGEWLLRRLNRMT